MNKKSRVNRLTIQLSNNLSSLSFSSIAKVLLEDGESEIFDRAMKTEDLRLEVL